MENLKLETIIPSSISDISLANEQSEFGGYSIALHRPTAPTADYQIRVNGSETHDNYLEANKNFHEDFSSRGATGMFGREESLLPKAEKIEYRDKVTGYELNKQCLSEEQLLKAFRIFDIGKDDYISEEDLVFVLDYIKEDYTQEEVKEMINMLSSDQNLVSFEDFKKLGKGHILPLANFKIPDSELKAKQQVLFNIEQNGILDEDPQLVIQMLKNDKVLLSRFEEHKNKAKANHPTLTPKTEVIESSKLLKNVPLRSNEEFRHRKQLFMGMVTTDPRSLLKNQVKKKYQPVSLSHIALILEITEKEARQLYPMADKEEVCQLAVLMESIAYGRDRIPRKVELCLDLISDGPTVQFCQIVHTIQVLKGRDESINNKLKAVCRNMELPTECQGEINKAAAVEMLSSFISVFFF